MVEGHLCYVPTVYLGIFSFPCGVFKLFTTRLLGCLRHSSLCKTDAHLCITLLPCMPISAQEIQSHQLEIVSRLHLHRLCQTLCSATARLLSLVYPSPLHEGTSESERPHATYRAPVRCDPACCTGAGPAPPRRLTCDLPRWPRHATALRRHRCCTT